MTTITRPQEYQGTVVTKKALSPKIIYLQLTPAKPVPFVEGHYGSWLIGSHRRPLSFASHHLDPRLDFVIDISPAGVCSQHTKQLTLNDTIRFLAPYGRFILDPDSHGPILFIAAGSGIAPIRSQIKKLVRDNYPHPFTLIFGNKDQDHLLFQDEFTALEKSQPNFHFIPVLSEPSNTWTGHKGLVTTVTPQVIPDLAEHTAYICGSPGMVADTTAMLLAHGLPPTAIHTEKFTE